MRTRPGIIAMVLAAAIVAVSADARAQGEATKEADAAPSYSLEVDSDASDVLTYEAIAARLASDLGGAVARAGEAAPTRASITVRYRDASRSLSVRAVHHGGQVLEREVRAEGDAAAVQREAVLLAGNLARDEARELIDALAARKPPAPPPLPALPAVAPPEKPPTTAPAEEERTFATFSVLYPLATNARRPDIRTTIAASLVYGRVGRVVGVDFGFGVSLATRGIRGSQLAMAANLSGADVDGQQLSIGANLARGRLHGLQLATAFNFVKGDATGAQIATGANIALARVAGAQTALVNVGGEVTGAQVGLVNVARQVKGAQVGLVNISDQEVEGAAIGLVNIAPNAFHPVFWTSNLAYTNIGIKFATKYAYTITAIGFGTNEAKLKLGDALFVVAVGAHLPITNTVDLDLETAYSDLDLESEAEANRALHVRALPGWSFTKHLRVFAGGGIRIPVAFDRGSPAVRPEGVAGVQF